jgi:hypothetical protein
MSMLNFSVSIYRYNDAMALIQYIEDMSYKSSNSEQNKDDAIDPFHGGVIPML